MIPNEALRTKAAPYPHLSKAPIVEAVIDFRATFQRPWQPLELETELKEKLPDFPDVKKQKFFEAHMQLGPDQAPQASARDLGLKGLMFRSADGLRVVQFQADGFGFSRLKPYPRWEDLKSEALSLWDIYIGLMQSGSIARIGVRYINRIPVDATRPDLSFYWAMPPSSPKTLNAPIVSFLERTTFDVPGSDCQFNLIKTIVPPTTGEPTPGLIIDVDVFTLAAPSSRTELETALEKMRYLKNQVFFGSITDSLVEILK